MGKRIAITGATGFVGSNVAKILMEYGHSVAGLSRRPMDAPFPMVVVDFSSQESLDWALAGFDAVVHCAINNDWTKLNQDPELAFDSYVGMTSRVARAALANDAQMVYISTDWILDGTQHLVPETQNGHPINYYGFLKAMGEQVVRDLHPVDGAVCRISGVMGRHQLAAEGPRKQDPGLGHFVYSIVEAIQAGEDFTVWNGPNINEVASMSLAAEIGAEIERVISRRVGGNLHLVSDDAVPRFELAKLVCEIFNLDQSLLHQGPPAPEDLFPEPVPVDTTFSNKITKQKLGLGPTPLRALLEAFKTELETGVSTALTKPE